MITGFLFMAEDQGGERGEGKGINDENLKPKSVNQEA